MSAFEKSFLDSSTGAKLRLYRMQVKGRRKAKGIVHITHGMCEHGGRYERFANFLTQNGYHAVASDHRGHGETICYGAPLGSFGREDGLAKIIEDTASVNAHLRNEFSRLPLIFFGHSMGAILGLNFCIQHSDKIDAAALWNAGVDGGVLLHIYNFLLKIERMLRGSDTASFIAKKLAFEDWNKKFAPNRTASDWLSRDEAEVDKYLTDPLCGFDASNGLWLEVLKAVKTGADDKAIAKIRKDLHVHLLAGGQDPCSDYGKAVERVAQRMKVAQFTDITCTIDPDSRHEALNELNREKIMSDFVSWLDERFAK